jgi:hypothetical protein
MAQSSSRRGLLIGFGVVLVVGGLVAAVALWSLGAERQKSAVEGFARAPVGCDTTLDFVETGEYLVFIETAGQLDGVRGDCDLEGSYDLSGATPDVAVTVVDPAGESIDLDRSFVSIDYDESGFVGSAAFTLDISETDDHVMRVQSNEGDVFVVAVGRDPSDGVAALRGGAAIAGLFGLFAGLVFILLGARRSKVTIAAGPWTPGAPNAGPVPFTPVGQAPQGPPVYGQQAGPPPYGGPQYGQQPTYGQAPQYGRAPQYAQQPPPPGAQPPPRPAPPQPPPPQPPAPQRQPPAPQYPPPPIPGQPAMPGQPTIPGQPGPPAIPGQPPMSGQFPVQPGPVAPDQFGRPHIPADPAGSTQPIDWSPQGSAEFGEPSFEAAAPDADANAQLDSERPGGDEDPNATQQRPVPPPN